MSDGLARFLRTVFQAVVGLLITGGFDALFAQLNRDIPTTYQPYLALGFTLLVTAAQNGAENRGIVPPMLKRVPAPDVPTP